MVTVHNKKYNFEIMDDLLDKCYSTLQRTLYGVQGNNSLHIAIQEKNMERAKQILDLDPIKLNSYNRNEQTPLHIAIVKNDLDMVNLLLGYYELNKDKCNINEGYGKTKNTVLHTLCGMSNVEDEVFNAIIKYPYLDVEVVNSDDNTPLHYFCEKNHSLNCKKLGTALIARAKKMDTFLNKINRNKESYMHKAVFNKKFRVFMVELLIKHNAKLDLKNDKGETPLHYAVRLSREDLCDILLKAGADPTVKTENNLTAREIADEVYAQDKSSKSAYNIVKTLKNVETLVNMLTNIGLVDHIEEFLKNGLYDLTELIELNRETLASDYGINLKLGPQIKLFKEIESLKKRVDEEEKVKQEEEEKERKKKAMLPPDEDDSSPTQDPEKVREELGLVNGNWEIEGSELEYTKKLGSGASGKVYRGLYKNKEVAIKVLTAVDAEDEMEEFRKEFLILTEVKSPHMVTFFGASIEPKLTMVMEYCQRGSLYHVLNNKLTDFTWDMALNFCHEMALGMSELHGWNPAIVHRDLKSLNLLVTQDWKIKVCDFGLSRFTGGNNLETFKKLCGTFAYCAPEIFNGGSFTDRSDVFSMGIVVWEIINRTMKGKYEQPYSEFNLVYDFQIIVQASQGLRPSAPPNTPQPLLDLITICTDSDVSKRPTASEVVSKIAEIKDTYKNNQEEWDTLLPFNKKADADIPTEEIKPKLTGKR